jgi:hypothetical protein
MQLQAGLPKITILAVVHIQYVVQEKLNLINFIIA